MTDEEQLDEPEEISEDIIEDSGELMESIRRMIRDEIEGVLQKVPGEGSVSDIKDDLDDEPVTLRAMEASVRRAVEEAMTPLREAQKKPPKKKPAPKKEAEPEPAPIQQDLKTKISSFLWGPND